ncbi:MAG TPA: hypothetical protein PLM53_15210 [Spirochaetota bacterium]|nr:hypothetical protein [Spirochaetota bacterium]HPC42151.1 hypothetical protein [Spirochaetota bacterium]HPL18597.1 hypothetical protein [Spirochaetota bacterium]HQF09677.1 hypothetical protein [Spirochaetota bacterium]HQH98445.1 hypothetical protein [Spirochaetota bacterium]
MKIRVIFFFLASMVIGSVAGGQAYAGAFTMGQFQTIASDGSLDVLRNPSLLTAQVQNNAIGFMFIAPPYTNRRYSYGATLGSTISVPDIHETKRLAGSLYLAYSGRTPRGTVGVAMDTDNPYQAMYTRHRRNYFGMSYDGTINFENMDISGTSLAVSPRLVVSYGIVVSGSHSLGLQWTLGYSRTREKSTVSYMVNAVINGYHWATKTMEDVAAEMSLGYSYRTETSQAGLMVRSGRFNWERTKINFGHNDFFNNVFFPGSVSEPFYLAYDRGFSVLAGGYHKLAPFIAVALEGEYEMPIHYNYKAVRYDETTAMFGLSNNITVRRAGLYAVRAGFEILPAGPVTVSMGGRVSTTRERGRSKNRYESINTDTYGGTLGLDIKAVDSLLIMVGSRLSYTHQRTVTVLNQEYLGSVSIDGLTRTLAVDLFLGMSGGF